MRIGNQPLTFRRPALLPLLSQTVVGQHTVSNNSLRNESIFIARISCTVDEPQCGAIGDSPPA